MPRCWKGKANWNLETAHEEFRSNPTIAIRGTEHSIEQRRTAYSFLYIKRTVRLQSDNPFLNRWGDDAGVGTDQITCCILAKRTVDRLH